MTSDVVAGISGNGTSNTTSSGGGGGYPHVRAGGGRRHWTGDSVLTGGRGVLPGRGDSPVRRYAVELFYLNKSCVEPPSSALNMTLPAFAAQRRRLQHGARCYR